MCRTWGSNSGPLACQANSLPIELPRHYELVSKFNVGLKPLLHLGLSEPEFYGDLIYKFKKIVGRSDFSDQFKQNIVRYKRIGYNINILGQSACLVFNPIRLITLLPSLIARRWVGRQTR